MRFADVPESLLLQMFQYLIDPNYLRNAYIIVTLSKQFTNLIKTFIRQEIQTKSTVLQHIQYLNIEYTLHLYACLLNSCLILIGGTQDTRRCDIFNVRSGKFKKICSIGLKRSEEFDAVCYRGYLFAISGTEEASVGSVEIYDLFTNGWNAFLPLPMKLAASASIVYNNRLFIIGGVDRTTASRSMLVYELLHDETFGNYGKNNNLISPSMPFTGNYVSSNFLLSSSSPPSNRHKINYSFNCSWEQSPVNLLVGRSHHSVVVYRGHIWIAGGIITGQWTATNTIEILKISSNTGGGQSIQGPSMLRCRLQPKLIVVDDCLYAVGGDMEGTVRSACSIEKYDNEKLCWKFENFFPEPKRRSKCAISGYENKIFIFGGSAEGGASLLSWDYYNTRTKLWASNLQSFIRKNDPLPPQVIVSKEERDFVFHADFSQMPTRPNGIKSALALPLSFS
jgi:hypothetical protein